MRQVQIKALIVVLQRQELQKHLQRKVSLEVPLKLLLAELMEVDL